MFATLFHTVVSPAHVFVSTDTNSYAPFRPEIRRYLETRVPPCDCETLHDLVFPHVHLENYTEMFRIVCVELREDLPTEQADNRVYIPEARQIRNTMKIVSTFAQEETGSGCLVGIFFEISSLDPWMVAFSWYEEGWKEKRFRNSCNDITENFYINEL